MSRKSNCIWSILTDYILDVHVPNILLGVGASIEVPMVTLLGRRLNASHSRIALFVLISSLCRSALDIPFGVITEYVGVRNVMLASLLLNALAAFVGWRISHISTLIIYCIMSGTSLGAFFLSRHIFVASISSRRHRGIVMAFLSGLLRWAHVIGPTAIGLITSYTHDVRDAFVFALCTSILAFLSIIVAPILRSATHSIPALSLTTSPVVNEQEQEHTPHSTATTVSSNLGNHLKEGESNLGTAIEAITNSNSSSNNNNNNSSNLDGERSVRSINSTQSFNSALSSRTNQTNSFMFDNAGEITKEESDLAEVDFGLNDVNNSKDNRVHEEEKREKKIPPSYSTRIRRMDNGIGSKDTITHGGNNSSSSNNTLPISKQEKRHSPNEVRHERTFAQSLPPIRMHKGHRWCTVEREPRQVASVNCEALQTNHSHRTNITTPTQKINNKEADEVSREQNSLEQESRGEKVKQNKSPFLLDLTTTQKGTNYYYHTPSAVAKQRYEEEEEEEEEEKEEEEEQEQQEEPVSSEETNVLHKNSHTRPSSKNNYYNGSHLRINTNVTDHINDFGYVKDEDEIPHHHIHIDPTNLRTREKFYSKNSNKDKNNVNINVDINDKEEEEQEEEEEHDELRRAYTTSSIPSHVPLTPTFSLTVLAPGLTTSETEDLSLRALFNTLRDSWHIIWRLGIAVVLFSAVRANRKLMMVFASMRAEMSDVQLSYVLSFGFCFDALLFPLGGIAMQVMGRYWALLPVSVGFCIVFGLLPLCHSSFAVYCASALFGIADSLSCGVVMTLTADYAPKIYGAPFFGIIRTLEDLGHVFGAGGSSILLRMVGFSFTCWVLSVQSALVIIWVVLLLPCYECNIDTPIPTSP